MSYCQLFTASILHYIHYCGYTMIYIYVTSYNYLSTILYSHICTDILSATALDPMCMWKCGCESLEHATHCLLKTDQTSSSSNSKIY